MLKGWEDRLDLVGDLTDDERSVARHLADCFHRHFIGPGMARTGKQISAYYAKQGIKMNGARVRKIIHALRVSDAVPFLLASSKGYYRSIDMADVARFEDSLRQREDSIRSARSAIYRQRQALRGGGQGNIF